MTETVGLFEWYREPILRLGAIVFVFSAGGMFLDGTSVGTTGTVGLAVHVLGVAIWSLALAVLLVFCWHLLKEGVRYLRRKSTE